MRLRKLAFPATLVVLAVVSYTATRSVAARLRVPAVRRGDDEPRPVAKETPGVAPTPRGYPGHIKSSYTMRQAGITLQGKSLHVTAIASLFHENPQMKFVWAVRLTAPDDRMKVVFERFYDHQTFSLPETKQLSPDFEDVIPIPKVAPGKYMAQVVIYEIYPPSKPEDFKDPKRLKQIEGPQYRQIITVKD